MALKLYLVLSGAVFCLVAVFHLCRLAYGWSIVVGPYVVPFALSYVGLPASSAYCVWATWLLRATRSPRPLPA
jgi:hypothetical protein